MLKKSLYVWLAICGCVGLLVPLSSSGQAPAQKAAAAEKSAPAAEMATKYRGARYEPNGRRDPFLNPLIQRKNLDVEEELPRPAPPPGIAGMYISQVQLIGLSLSPEAQIAAFKGTDQRVYFLRAGDRLYDGYVKSITIDSVLLIHETKLRGGKVLTEEITKRLRT